MSKQIALIARWHGEVIDAATRLLALSCFDNNRFVSGRNAIEDDLLSFNMLSVEFTVEVIDVLHEYCFLLRKLIERTGKIKEAKTSFPHQGNPTAVINKGGTREKEVALCDKSLWWILGRVMHSKSVVVVGGENCELTVYSDGKTREYEDARCYVEVESDKDNGQTHILYIPSLVGSYTFSALRHEIEEIVNANTMR